MRIDGEKTVLLCRENIKTSNVSSSRDTFESILNTEINSIGKEPAPQEKQVKLMEIKLKKLNLNQMEKDADELFSEFKMEFNGLLIDNNISLNDGFKLKVNANGKIIVTGDDDNKYRVERLFEENPALAEKFRNISDLESEIKTLKLTLEFQKAYQKNMKEAVKKYHFLFDSKIEYSMELKEGKFVKSFSVVKDPSKTCNCGDCANGNNNLDLV